MYMNIVKTLSSLLSLMLVNNSDNKLSYSVKPSITVVYPEFPTNLDNLDLSKAPPNDEQRLLRHIMRAYDRAVRPVYQASSVVSIAVGMTLAHIFNVVRILYMVF